MTVFDQITPIYTVYFYTDFLYKVIKFKRLPVSAPKSPVEEVPEARFSQSYSRSRSMVLQYALCNQWDYFITITLDPSKFDRYGKLEPIWNVVYEFFRFYRNTYSPSFRYLLVPELHKDGGWHFHGLVAGVLPSHLSLFVPGLHPQKLVDGHFLNWALLANVSGFVSLGELKNPTACAFYVTKYITKQHAHDDLYEHLYYCSRGLSRAKPVADCYCYNSSLESCLTFENDYLASGWARLASPDISFPLALDGVEARFLEELSPAPELAELDIQNPNFVQLSLDDWLIDCGVL